MIYIKAVGEIDVQILDFFSSSESTVVSSLSLFLDSHEKVGSVKTTTLSVFLRNKNISKIDFLKIDIEGHDIFALRGHDWNVLPKIILCEFEDSKTTDLGYTYEETGDLLLSKGYEVLLCEWAPIVKYGTNHSFHKIEKYPTQLSDLDGWGNFIAISKEYYDEFTQVLKNDFNQNV